MKKMSSKIEQGGMSKQIYFEKTSLFIETEINNKHIEQLIFYSHGDAEVRKYTSDLERFSNTETFEKWLSQERKVYVLIDNPNEKNLLGIIWFGKKALPEKKYIVKFDNSEYTFTFAIRIYGPARGKGYSKQFMEEAFDGFINTDFYNNSSEKGFWLETSSDNIPAVKLYKNFGFSQVTKPDTNNKIIMLYNPKISK